MIRINNARALYVEEDKLWIASGLNFYAVDFSGKRISRQYKIGCPIYKIRFLRHLSRNGIHHLIPLKNGNFLVVVKKKTIIINPDGDVVNVFSGYHGNKPAHRGVCLTPNGFIFFGEYSLNPDRKLEVRLYRSVDNGLSFQNIYTFKPGEIRHIHFIEWDEYSKCIWIGTGDYGKNDSECRMYRSDNYGDSFELVGEGSQLWRSIAICPTKNYLYWGTDAGHSDMENKVLRLDKNTHHIDVLASLSGPCHGMCVTKNNRVFISSGVEGGQNETDKFAKLYEVDNTEVKEIKRIKKDLFPFIVQFGVIRFPMGCANSTKVIYTTFGLKKNGETIYITD